MLRKSAPYALALILFVALCVVTLWVYLSVSTPLDVISPRVQVGVPRRLSEAGRAGCASGLVASGVQRTGMPIVSLDGR